MITALLEKQQRFYRTGATIPVSFRIAQLKKLYKAVKDRQAQINAALTADLGKSDWEGFMCESGLVLTEISHMLRHVKSYAKAKTVSTPLPQFPSRSFTQAVPYGNVLIMSPWNYPFLLTIEPLANAIAAGNTAIIKPSAYAPATAQVVKQLIEDCFDPEYIAVVTGGRAENAALLEQKFDMIFFTGSQAVGREVLRHAAEHLTPVVLELGGKSPCIVEPDADIALSARRIVFGKYLNCGQTCVAPDYILCHSSVKDALIQALCREITRQFGQDPLANPNYGKIINQKHFDRICGLIDPKKVVCGGNVQAEACRIAPTVMDRVTWDDPVMQQEIFGPVLPVLTYEDFDAMLNRLKTLDSPLALYLFTGNKSHMKRVTRELSYGGGCINDVVIHLATSAMGFGGVGGSGMGAYHGKDGFEAFSHRKSIVHKKTWLDLPIRYQPYTRRLYKKLLHFFLK